MPTCPGTTGSRSRSCRVAVSWRRIVTPPTLVATAWNELRRPADHGDRRRDRAAQREAAPGPDVVDRGADGRGRERAAGGERRAVPPHRLAPTFFRRQPGDPLGGRRQ